MGWALRRPGTWTPLEVASCLHTHEPASEECTSPSPPLDGSVDGTSESRGPPRGGGEDGADSLHTQLPGGCPQHAAPDHILERGSKHALTRSQVTWRRWSGARASVHPPGAHSLPSPSGRPPSLADHGLQAGLTPRQQCGPRAWPFRSLPSAAQAALQWVQTFRGETSLSRQRASSCPVCELGRQPPRGRAEPKTG